MKGVRGGISNGLWQYYVADELSKDSRDKYVDGSVYGSFSVAGDTPAMCVDLAGSDPGYADHYVVADNNTTASHIRDKRTFNVDTDLARKFAAKWGDAISAQDWQTIASQSGVSGADATNAQLAASMAVWSLQGRPIDRQVVRGHLFNARAKDVDNARTEEVRKIAHAMVSQAENYSAPSDEAEPATVKISQGDRTENGDGTVIPISVTGSSDDNKATLNVEGLPAGAKLTDANGNTVNNGDEISVPSELKLTIPNGTDPGQAKVSATTTKTSKLPAGTMLKPVGNDDSQSIITLKPGKDVPSNATAGINVKWDKETPSSSSSSSPSPSSSSPATSSTPKPVVPSSTSSESTTSSSRVTSSSTTPAPSSTSSSVKPSSTSPSDSSTTSTSSSTPVVPKNDNPKISTTVDVDGKKSAEGNPVKVDASKLHEGINVKDHIDYEGLAPDTKYEFTGTLMKVENGKASPVSGVKPASTIETIGKDGKGTATVDFGKITDLKPDTQYVVFEKAVPVDKSENPTVDNNGTPKNPSEDKRETVTHEDADDDSQTFVSGGESSSSTTPAPSSTSSSVKPSSSEVTSTSKPAPPAGIHQSPSSTSSTSPSESSTTSTSSSTPKPSKGKISTTVDVDGQRATDEEPVMVEAAKAKEGINVKDHIDYEGLKPGTYRFTGTLMKIEDGVAKPVSGVEPASVYETVGDSGKGTATVDFGKLTRLKADTQYVVFEKAIPVDSSKNPTVNNDGTPKNPSKDDRETVKHEDSNDTAQTFVTQPEDEVTASSTSKPAPPAGIHQSPSPSTSETTTSPSTTSKQSPSPSTTSQQPPAEITEGNPKISTTVDVDGKRASEDGPVFVDAAKAKEGINVKDHIDYEGLKPGTYRFTGTLMKIEDGVAKPVSGVEPASVYETVGDSGKGTATVDFGKLTRLKADTQYVVFEKAVPVNGLHIPTVKNDGTPKNPNKDDRETVKHEDSNDAAQTFVTTPEGETVPPTSSTTPPSSDKPETPGSESPTPDTDKPGKPEDNKTPGKPVPGKPVPGKPSETPDKPGAPKETTPQKPSDSTDNGKSETPGKPGKPGKPSSEAPAQPGKSETPGQPGESGTPSSETPAPSDNNGNSGHSNGADNDNNGSDNGGSDNGSNGSNGSSNGSGNGSNGSGSGSGSSSSHGVGGALASTGANVIWLALLAMILIGAGAGVVLWNRRRSHEG